MFKCCPGGGLRRGGPRRGQALLIAVLLMGVILLVGILFAAVVSFNQEQSARHLDLVAAQLQAEAGVSYASKMLENSPQGADWRPRFVPYAGTGTELVTIDAGTVTHDFQRELRWNSVYYHLADGL